MPKAMAALDRPVQTLPLPTRTLRWCARHQIATVREFLAWSPDVLAREVNLGRGKAQQTRQVLESLLGCTWEEACSRPRGRGRPPKSSSAATPVAGEGVDADARRWTEFAAGLTREARDLPLGDLVLPVRMRRVIDARGLERVGELFEIPHATLMSTPHVGRRSLEDTVDAVRKHLLELAKPARRRTPWVHATFLDAWHAELATLDATPRMVVTRRAGLQGERETLEQIGSSLGVTRERIRQIEARAVGRLSRRSSWRSLIDAQLARAFGSGQAFSLEPPMDDPWWAGLEHPVPVLEYVLRRIFDFPWFTLDAPSGRRYLTKFDPSEFVAHLEQVKARIAKLEYPAPLSTLDELLRVEVQRFDLRLFDEFRFAIDELLIRDPDAPTLAMGFGASWGHEVLAFLSGQPEPVHVHVLERYCGRGGLPKEVLHFGRGHVGLKRHFPDFDHWMGRLVPLAVQVMQSRPPGRQWLVSKVHQVLAAQGLVPDWLGPAHLGSLMRLSGKVDYLGRLRVALKNTAQAGRLQYDDLLYTVLIAARTPLALGDLLARARFHSDLPDASAATQLARSPFVRLGEGRIGLVDRDVPGGAKAVEPAILAVVRVLTDTQVGLTPHQATSIVRKVSKVHATWTRPIVTSILRWDARLRGDHTGNFGLATWDDARCPSRNAFVRLEVERAGGTLPIAQLCARLEALYGRAPDRSELGQLASKMRLTIRGRMMSLMPPPPGGAAP